VNGRRTDNVHWPALRPLFSNVKLRTTREKHFCFEAYENTSATYMDTVQELLKCIAPHSCRKAIDIFWSVYADVAPEQLARSRGAAKD
jgi:hypothetical protein